MRAWITQATRGFLYAHTEALFRPAVYLWCLINFALMVPGHRQFWAPGNYIPPVEGFESYRYYFALDLLSDPVLNPFYGIAAALYGLLLVLGLMGKFPRVSAVGSFVLSAVFALRAHFIFDGGDRLMLYLLFYLSVVGLLKVPGSGPCVHLMRNLAFLSVKLQVCLVYATAGLAKFGGELWPRGEALYYALHADEYTHPWVRDLLGDQLVLLTLGTYSIVFFQLVFPVLVWNPRLRPWVVGFGTFVHLQIALVLGIASFGFALMVGYCAFYSNEEALSITSRLKALAQRRLDCVGALRRIPTRASTSRTVRIG